jgi:hypothetical protein
VEVSEDFFRPEVNAALSGIAVRQFDYRDALRPEKEKQSYDPKPDSDAAIGGDAGHDIEIEDGDYKEQHQIEAAEYAL